MWPWVLASAGLAILMAVWSVAEIGVIPPRLTPRALEMASATTHVIVDTPRSSILDLRQDTYSLEALRQRTVVLGSVWLRAKCAKRLRIEARCLPVSSRLPRR